MSIKDREDDDAWTAIYSFVHVLCWLGLCDGKGELSSKIYTKYEERTR